MNHIVRNGQAEMVNDGRKSKLSHVACSHLRKVQGLSAHLTLSLPFLNFSVEPMKGKACSDRFLSIVAFAHLFT